MSFTNDLLDQPAFVPNYTQQFYPSPESTAFYTNEYQHSNVMYIPPEDCYSNYYYPNTIVSEASSLGIRTPDIDFTEMMPQMYSYPLMMEYYSYPPMTLTKDHMTCLQKSPSEPVEEETENVHACLWVNCQAKAPTLEKLMIHICDVHVGSGKAIYFCEWKDCSRNKKPFMKRHKMHNHMRTHTGERPFVCTVIDCKKTFSRPDSLSTHIKTHSDIRPYLCSVPGCEKAYFHSRSLRKHVKSFHLKSNPLSVRRNTPSRTKAVTQKKEMIQSPVENIQLNQAYQIQTHHPQYTLL